MKYKQQKLKILFLLLFIIFCLLFTKTASAQSLSLSISPPIFELMIRPGKSITQTFTLTNLGEETIITPRLAIYSENGLIEDKSYQREEWISFVSSKDAFDKSFILENDQSRQFILRINPPVGTEEKDYYRALLFSSSPNPPSEYSQSQISQAVGSILLINVTTEGLINKAAQISKVVLSKIHDSFTPLTSEIYVKNGGKTYFRPIGKITLTGLLGRASYNIEPNVILAGQERLLVTQDERSIGVSNKTFNIPGFYIGKYTLETDFVLDEGNIRINRVDEFYAFPWKAIAVLLIIFLLYKLKKRRKKH